MLRCRRVTTALALAGLACSAACDRSTPPAPPAPVQPESGPLPAQVGAFVGGPVEKGATWTRRRYERGAVHFEVTVAGPTGTVVQYAQWVEMAAGYPPLPLDLPTDDALGFYDCTGTGADERCDAHIQTRSGLHVEVNTGGSATRGEVTAFVDALSTRRLAATPATSD